MSFEPFVVSCLTCGRQLRVTNPALVGTISQCPKCGAMVQVDPPEQPIAVGSEPVDSEAITEESVQPPESPPDAAPEAPFDDAPALPPPDSDPAAAAPLDWQSERTARTRQIALVIAVSLSGLLAATLVFGWFVFSWRDDAGPVAAAGAPDAPPPEQADGGDPAPVPAESAPEAAPAPQDPAAPDPAPQGSGPTGGVEQVSGGAPTATPPAGPGPAGGAADATPDKASEPASDAPVDSQPQDPDRTGAAAPVIPEDLLPEGPLAVALGREEATAEASEAGDANAAGQLQELPPGLRQFTPFLDQPGTQPAVAPTLDPPSTIEEIELERAAEDRLDPMMIANPPEPIDLDRAMAIEMAVDTRGYPLTDFVLLISQVTGAPIQVDWLSFDLAGVDVAGAVAPRGGGWQSAADLLDAVAASCGAEVRRRESLLELTVAEPVFAEKFNALVALDDFADDRQAAAALLDRFLAGAPNPDDAPPAGGGSGAEGEAPEEAGGDVLANAETPPAEASPAEAADRSRTDPREPSGELSARGETVDAAGAEEAGSGGENSADDRRDDRWRPPGQTRQRRQLAALAVDALRRMRGLEPKIPDERFRRWAVPARSASAGWQRLDGGNAGPQYDAPITLAELLRRTARRNQATCLVNWYDVRRRRVSPEQLTMPYTGEPAAEMLERTLDPFGLQVRQVDSRHWWVGTEATYDRLPVLVWTEPLGQRRERLRVRLDRAMAGATRDTYRFVHDPVSDRALLLLPRFVLAQFDKLRKPDPPE